MFEGPRNLRAELIYLVYKLLLIRSAILPQDVDKFTDFTTVSKLGRSFELYPAIPSG